MTDAAPVKILFVCLGNICRSPTAHAVMRQKVRDQHMDHRFLIDSAGTGDWHLGKAPDKRAIATGASSAAKYDLSDLRARLVTRDDFHAFDLILAMDRSNFSHLQALRPAVATAELALFMQYAFDQTADVPDPYYEEDQAFREMLTLVENGCDRILERLLNSRVKTE